MIKPKKIISKELEEISVTVEAEYRAEVKADQQKALAAMQRRLIEEARDKERKEQEQADQAAADAALIEARQILGLEGEA